MKYIIFFSFLFATCNNQSTIPAASTEDLCQCWRFSYEESEEELKIYRPCSYNFPPSRGREGMTFAANKTFVYDAVAPTDGLMKLKGNWTLKGNVLSMNYTTPNRKIDKFTIVSLTKEMMKLKSQ